MKVLDYHEWLDQVIAATDGHQLVPCAECCDADGRNKWGLSHDDGEECDACHGDREVEFKTLSRDDAATRFTLAQYYTALACDLMDYSLATTNDPLSQLPNFDLHPYSEITAEGERRLCVFAAGSKIAVDAVEIDKYYRKKSRMYVAV